jgi:hypothetical protein
MLFSDPPSLPLFHTPPSPTLSLPNMPSPSSPTVPVTGPVQAGGHSGPKDRSQARLIPSPFARAPEVGCRIIKTIRPAGYRRVRSSIRYDAPESTAQRRERGTSDRSEAVVEGHGIGCPCGENYNRMGDNRSPSVSRVPMQEVLCSLSWSRSRRRRDGREGCPSGED